MRRRVAPSVGRVSSRRGNRVIGALAVACLAATAASCSRDLRQAPAPRPPPVPPAAEQSSASSQTAGTTGIDVAAENRKPGSSAWSVSDSAVGAQDAIEGYTDLASVAPGQSFRLYVSTTAASFTASAYRIGYYGGTDATEVWRSPQTHGVHQTAQSFDSSTRTVECDWQPSLTVDPSGWVPGEYLIKLVSSAGNERYVPLVVHSTSTVGKIVILAGITTWQAYNDWGGLTRSYHGPDGNYSSRAYAVSFDRPYLDPDEAAGDEACSSPSTRQLVSFAEQHDLPVAYETDLELETGPQLFDGARAIVSDGHDEYYSATMRSTLQNARDQQGTNLAFLGANAIFRHIRWASTQLGADRLVICYKDSTLDPITSKAIPRTPPRTGATPLTRGRRIHSPVRSTSAIRSTRHTWCTTPTTGSLRGRERRRARRSQVSSVRSTTVSWTSRRRRIRSRCSSHSPLTCQGTGSYQESAYYTVPSGAGVFDAGTMRWECALGSECSAHFGLCRPQLRATGHTQPVDRVRAGACGQGPPRRGQHGRGPRPDRRGSRHRLTGAAREEPTIGPDRLPMCRA